jgi:excisionase family DNA binding protein
VTTPLNGSGDLELLTPDQLCDLLQVKKSWLYDQVESGKFPCLRLGKQLRFRREDVARYLESQLASCPVGGQLVGECLRRQSVTPSPFRQSADVAGVGNRQRPLLACRHRWAWHRVGDDQVMALELSCPACGGQMYAEQAPNRCPKYLYIERCCGGAPPACRPSPGR